MARRLPRITLSIAAGATEDQEYLSSQRKPGMVSGLMCLVKAVISTMTANPTTSLFLLDPDGDPITIATLLAKGATHIIPVSLPLVNSEQIKATLTVAPGAGGATITIDVSFIPDYI